MTEQKIKEYLSRHFIGLVASRRGFKTNPILPDNGTDLVVSRAIVQQRPQGRRIVDDPNVLHLQLKCTCLKSTVADGDGFKYDLDVVAYNDLVEKWSARHYNKSLLILMVLPDEVDNWLEVGPEELIMRRAAYWYEPEPNATICHNAESYRIRVPYANAVDLNLFEAKFAEYYA